jgi:hypothetical protein
VHRAASSGRSSGPIRYMTTPLLLPGRMNNSESSDIHIRSSRTQMKTQAPRRSHPRSQSIESSCYGLGLHHM